MIDMHMFYYPYINVYYITTYSITFIPCYIYQVCIIKTPLMVNVVKDSFNLVNHFTTRVELSL